MSEFNIDAYLQEVEASTCIEECPKVPIPSILPNQNYVFISYSHRDYKAVYSDLAHLFNKNVRFWYDKGLSAGREWEIEVEEHIKHPNCCGIIFYISTNMFLSDSVLKEIEFTREKKGKFVYQKNYFCVNLHRGNISDILFDAQVIDREREPKERKLNTKIVNTLTATFSDSATYISVNDRFHLETLIEQIQQQFDVTSKPDSSAEQSIFHSVNTPKAAIRAVLQGKIELIALCKYVYSCYWENKSNRPWYILPATMITGLIIMVVVWCSLFSMPDNPLIQFVLENYSTVTIIGCGVLFCGILWIYAAVMLFWLYYLSPVYQKYQSNPRLMIGNHIHFDFLLTTLLAALCIPILYIEVLLLFNALTETVAKVNTYM